MKSNNIVIIVIVLIVVIGIGIWIVMSKKGGEVTPTQTCEELGGICCTTGQTCQGGTFMNSSNCKNLCCVGGSCVGTEVTPPVTEGEINGIPLPKYAGMTKIMEQRDEEAGDFSMMYGIEGADKTEEIKDFYKTKLVTEGWKLDSETFLEGSWMLAFSKGEDYSLQVTIGYSEDATQLVLTYDGPSKAAEENPYDSATEVAPASELNTAFHNDFKAVLESVFGGSKLTSSSSTEGWEDLDYIAKRKITAEDAQRMKDLLEAKGYTTISSKAGSDKYDYTFSKEVSGTKYEDIEIDIWLAGEGSNQQKVSITVYK
jgi:hypothetical protein